ncbi:MAG: molybdenum cofactor biosynthesis protein MoaE [Dehalococcoidia bacterium]|nr:molybdenum cofactor biosynthesis protein MoaE [Dehalococcoidia bacterium]
MKNEIKIINHSIEIVKVREFLRNNRSGAIVIFEGVVREFNKGEKIKNITYEAYEAMAIKEITKILNEQRKKLTNNNEIHSICIHHRVGKLNVGETSIIIGVSSEHREQAFLLCSNIMDQIKISVPIWKFEMSENGTYWV